MEASQNNRTRDKVAHSRINHHQLLFDNWNALTFTGQELMEETKRYHLDIVGVSSTKRRSSGPVNLDGRKKLFYSGADPSVSAQGGLEILTKGFGDTPVVRLLSGCQIGFLWNQGLHIEAQSREFESVNMPVASICSKCFE